MMHFLIALVDRIKNESASTIKNYETILWPGDKFSERWRPFIIPSLKRHKSGAPVASRWCSGLEGKVCGEQDHI
jgi:hypothetical protein